jgi:histidinol-phosphate aminotransferase
MTLALKPGVLDIRPYVGGRAEVSGAKGRVFKLSSNETPFGPSEKALAAFRKASANLFLYPEGSARLLREALAAAHGLEDSRIVCGNGSSELLTLLAGCYLRPRDEVLMSRHGFLLYKIAALANSATPVEVPEPALKTDVDAMLARVTDRTRLVYIANPNNPTGTWLSASELKRLHAGLPASALLVVDAAYGEYAQHSDYDSGLELARSSDNVVMIRTFSKIYGLAGLRVGWAYGPDHVIGTLNRVRGPFSVNIAAQRAAIAALEDRAHLEKSVRHNATWRACLTKEIREAGFEVTESAANFLLIHFRGEQGRCAGDADRFLTARGLILRGMIDYNLPNCLRLTIGSEEANRAVVDALREFAAAP